MKSGSRKVVLAALLGNMIITIVKFVVALITTSSAMLAETVHSLADTGNQALLLLGLKRSQKPADEQHPFGYGQEQYFWSFVVANMLFFVGAVVSIYAGVDKIQNPHSIEKPWLIYVILGFSCLVESCALLIAYREFDKHRPAGLGLFAAIRRSKDTNVVVVLLEDSAALCGLAIAFVGVALSVLTGSTFFDALASILIGLLLAAVAFVLAREIKELLIGESASPANRKAIRDTIISYAEVKAIGQVLTMHLAPNKILVTMDVEFTDELLTDDIERVIDRMEAAIREQVPSVDKIFIEADRVIVRPARPGGK